MPRYQIKLGDPKKIGYRNPQVVWTEGEFEFLVKVYLGSVSLVGSELKTYFRANGNDLFRASNGSGRGGAKYSMYLKKKDMKLPLFEEFRRLCYFCKNSSRGSSMIQSLLKIQSQQLLNLLGISVLIYLGVQRLRRA